MMLSNELLIERILTLTTVDEKMKYADKVWEILQMSYKDIGGFKSAESAQELATIDGVWKLVRRGDQITAVSVYRDAFGRKSIGSGTNQTQQGKMDYKLVKSDDIKMRRAWTEVSGAPERILQKVGAKPIPNKFASFLTGKEIIRFNDDGYHYTRLIMGEPHEKIIYGFVNLTDGDLMDLQAAGLGPHELLPFKS